MIEKDVGTAFVQKYYSTYTKNPVDLANMYSKASIFAHAGAGSALEFTEGRDEIQVKLAEIAEEDGPEIKFTLHSVDCIPAINGSVMILVQGVKLTRECTRPFYHTFLLGQNRGTNKGFYIHNDIMRQGEGEQEDDDDFDEEEEEAEYVEEAPAAAEPTPVSVAAATPPSVAAAAPAKAVSPKAAPVPAPAPVPAATAAEVVDEPAAAPAAPPAAARPKTWANLAARAGDSAPAAHQPIRIAGGMVQKGPAPTRGSRDAGKGGDRGRAAGGKGAKGGDVRRTPSAPGRGGKGRGDNEHYSIYVTRLPDDFADADVEQCFGRFGKIVGSKLQDAWNAGSSGKGGAGKRCFVDYTSKEAVEAAVNAEVLFKGKRLNVQERRSAAQREADRAGKGY